MPEGRKIEISIVKSLGLPDITYTQISDCLKHQSRQRAAETEVESEKEREDSEKASESDSRRDGTIKSEIAKAGSVSYRL